jgi:hypothetical protein
VSAQGGACTDRAGTPRPASVPPVSGGQEPFAAEAFVLSFYLWRQPTTDREEAKSLSRFAYKPFKNRRSGDFYLANSARTKGPQEPENRDFYGFFNEKSHKNLQV